MTPTPKPKQHKLGQVTKNNLKLNGYHVING